MTQREGPAKSSRLLIVGTKPKANALYRMIDPIDDVLAPTVIERALGIFGSFKDRASIDLVQARKALTPHVFGLISSGQIDEKRLVVWTLIYLKSLKSRGDET